MEKSREQDTRTYNYGFELLLCSLREEKQQKMVLAEVYRFVDLFDSIRPRTFRLLVVSPKY